MGLGHGNGNGNGNGNGTGKQNSLADSHSKVSITVGMACACSFVYVLALLFMSAHPCWTTASCQQAIPCPNDASVSSAAAMVLGEDYAMPPKAAEVDPGGRRNTELSRIVFGIAAATDFWWGRKEYLKLWWRPAKMRGYVFLDKQPYGNFWPREWPPYRISENTSHFQYTYKGGSRSAIRISRIVAEMVRMQLPQVDWFVVGDDDTLFFGDNLVQVLSKYDHTQMFYIGSNSESHIQNIMFSHAMAFGGGGFAISYPLAKALAKMQDDCLSRYPYLYGSDDRTHACMAELGVPLTKEPGFHQLDIVGDISGLLAAHPVAPLVTLHHLEIVKLIFPNTATRNFTRVKALKHLLKAAEVESGSIVQQSICYAQNLRWSVSVSWGYVVQVYKGFVSPRDLQVPQRTFKSWYKQRSKVEFAFNTREDPEDVCKQPTRFFMDSVTDSGDVMTGVYIREFDEEKHQACADRLQPLTPVQSIRVTRMKLDQSWYQMPRRSCCRVKNWSTENVDIHVGPCEEGESLIGNF